MARRFRIERFLGTVLLAVLLSSATLISMPRWISATKSSDPLPVLPHASDGFNESIDEVDTGIEQGEEPDGGSRRSLRSSAPLASSGASQITAEQRAAIEHRIIVAATGLEDRVDISDLGVTLHTDSQEDMDLIFVLLDEAVQDDPDLFYLCCNLFARIHPSGSTTMTAIGLRYSFPKDDIPAMRETYEAAMQEMLAWIPDGASDLERIRAVHDYLRTEVSYDNDVEESTVSEMIADGSILSYTPYAALVDREDGSRKAVCQGYALAFSAAMRRLGIPCIYVKQDVTVQDSSGLHSERHAWNRVQLDGNWYSVDTTWDSVNNSYRYLLKSDEWWISHPDSRGFHSAWSPSDAPAGTDTAYDSYGFGDPYTGPTEHATVTGFQLSDSAIGLDPEEEYQLAIVGVAPAGASIVDASSTSSDPGIVIVDSAGRLYATMEEGTAIITCTIDGIPRSCTVNVGTAGPDDPGVLVPKPTSRTVRNNGTEQA
ncbi:MAG: hypothetical protein IJH87_01095, partial [Atopobiaceae bacterium]|nr:hypothetical protein [Atopobiaceae bacterium]